MTEKHWFIFRGDHHLGPFSFDEILTKVKLTEIDQEELTWCEGSEEWLPVKEQPLIQSALKEESSTQKEEEERLRKEEAEAERQAYLKEQERWRQKEEAEKRALELKRKKEEERLRLEKERVERERKEREAEQKRLQQLKEEREKKERPQTSQVRPEDEFDGPPPLPPLPIEEDLKEAPPTKLVEPALPGLPSMEESPLEVKGELEEKMESEEELESFELPKKENSMDPGFPLEDEDFFEPPSGDDEVVTGLRFYIGLGLAFFGLIICVYLVGQMLPGERPLHHLAGAHRDALKSVRQRPYKGRAIHRLRPSKDLNSLWLASNYPYEAALFISLETIPGRSMSDTPVELQARAVLRGGAAHFDEIKILKGESIPQGEYEYVVKGKRIGIMGKLFSAIGDKPLFKSLSFSKEYNQEITFRGKVLLSTLPENQFESRLDNRQSYLNKQVIRPLKDRLERYKTFMGLLQRVENIYQAIMRRITRGSSMEMFEKQYNEEVGPFLRDLIIDSNRLHISLLNLQPKESKAYEELMNFGKGIGEIASEMVTKTRSHNSLGRERTENLIEHFGKKVAELKNEGQQHMERIKSQLARYNSESEQKPQSKE